MSEMSENTSNNDKNFFEKRPIFVFKKTPNSDYNSARSRTGHLGVIIRLENSTKFH